MLKGSTHSCMLLLMYLLGVDRASVNVLDVVDEGFIVVASNPTTPHTVVSKAVW